MTPSTDLSNLDGLGIAALIASKDVSAAEVLEDAIERIERLNPIINAVIFKMFEEARQNIRRDQLIGPFAGVPFLLKDLLSAAYKGTPSSMASALLRDRPVDYDTEVVSRYKAAGLVTIGKTNLPNFGPAITTEPRSFGPTLNPWDLTRMAAGSSGGAAAAVAARMVPIAHGTDAAGSLRVPASHCGVFTMKPTRGRISAAPDGESLGGMGNTHVLTRTVRDCAAMLDVTAGYVPGDPYMIPTPPNTYLSDTGRDPPKLKVAFSTVAPNGVPVDPDCVAAVEQAARLCEDMGHYVEVAAPSFDFTALTAAFAVVHGAHWAGPVLEMARNLGREPTPEEIEGSVLAWARHSADRSAVDYAVEQKKLHRFSREIAKFFVNYDVLITPCAAQPALPLGVIDTMEPDFDRYMEMQWRHMAFTAHYNVTGQPAMSVPMHWTKGNLPVGVQVIGQFGDESTLFRLAAQIERVRPWGHRKPPLIQS